MLLVQQYDALLRQQYHDASRRARKISRFFKPDFQYVYTFFLGRPVKKANISLIGQLMSSKGLLADVEKKAVDLNEVDLKDIIGMIDHIIKINITLRETVSERLKTLGQKFPDISSWDSILEETIDNFYAVLRILKRHHHTTPITTSTLAKDSSKCSLTSLEMVSYDHRTT
jgi:hypothetical protein